MYTINFHIELDHFKSTYDVVIQLTGVQQSMQNPREKNVARVHGQRKRKSVLKHSKCYSTRTAARVQ